MGSLGFAQKSAQILMQSVRHLCTRFIEAEINRYIYIYLDKIIYLTAIGLTPGGSSTHLHT